MQCSICGAKFQKGERYTKDHVFPIAIYKWASVWCPDETERAEIIQKLSSAENIQYAHEKCNFAKADSIPELQTLALDEEDFEVLQNMKKTLEAHIESFTDLKDSLLIKQKYKCYCCGMPLVTGTIRRINPDHARTIKNACIVCTKCGEDVESFTHISTISRFVKSIIDK